MAKYKYSGHIAPELPEAAYQYAYRIIGRSGDYLALWLSNTPFVYAQYGSWPTYSKGWCLPYEAPNPGCYIYHIGTDKIWWKSSTVRTEYGNSDENEKEWIICQINPTWTNVDILNENGKVALAASAPKLYCPDPPTIEAFYNVLGEGSTSNAGVNGVMLTLPQITGEMSKYLYGRAHNYLNAVSPDGATVHAQLFCNGSLIASVDGSGAVQHWHQIPYTTVGSYQFHAVVYCSMYGAEADSEAVTTQTVYAHVNEYDYSNYDPNTGIDKSGQITPGVIIPTDQIDDSDSTIDPSEDVVDSTDDTEEEEPEEEEERIDISEDDPAPPIVIDDTVRQIILEGGSEALSYYLGYRLGVVLRGQMNGFDDVDAFLQNGVLYIRDAKAAQSDTLVEVT